MAQVALHHYTGMGTTNPARTAAELLVSTKMTRLKENTPVEAMTDEQIKGQLEYMVKTIPSSWEFLDVIFIVEGVSRACAQQITRTRTGSYAMQSQRVVNVLDLPVVNPFHESTENAAIFASAVESAAKNYDNMVSRGIRLEDARGILPMNTSCSIWCKYNFRAFVDLVRARRSNRTQGEYRDIVEQMYNCVVTAWPWAEPFFRSTNEVAVNALQSLIDQQELNVGSGLGWELAKIQDLLRK